MGAYASYCQTFPLIAPGITQRRIQEWGDRYPVDADIVRRRIAGESVKSIAALYRVSPTRILQREFRFMTRVMFKGGPLSRGWSGLGHQR